MTEEKPLPAHVQFKSLTSVAAKYIPYHDSKPEPTVVRIAQDRAVDQASCSPEDLPVPPLPIRHQATESEYVRTGKARFEDMMRILQSENIGLNGQKILDFGCGAGRIVRWFIERAKAGQSIWGVDLDS